MAISDRNWQIYHLRNEGKNYSEIARKFSLSRERIKQIIEVVATHDALPTFEKEFSTMVQKGLSSLGLFDDVQKIVLLGAKEIKRIKNIGSKGINEIADVLYRHGYITDLEKWIQS